MFIICSARFSRLYKNYKTRNIFNCSNNSLLVCSLIELKKNNYLQECNSQLSRFVFYLNRLIAASLSWSFISCEIHGLKWDVKPPKRIRGTEDAKYSPLDLCCRVTFQVSHSPSNKTRSSMFTTNLSIPQRRLNFKYRTKPREWRTTCDERLKLRYNIYNCSRRVKL